MTPLVQQAHAEFTDDGILVLFPNGEVGVYATPEDAVRRIRKRDEATLRTAWRSGPRATAPPDMILTELTWHEAPPGFVAPGTEATT